MLISMPIDIYLVLILYMISYHAIHILNLVPPDTKDPIFGCESSPISRNERLSVSYLGSHQMQKKPTKAHTDVVVALHLQAVVPTLLQAANLFCLNDQNNIACKSVGTTAQSHSAEPQPQCPVWPRKAQ